MTSFKNIVCLYFVYNGHTLGYVQNIRITHFCPLQGKAELGGMTAFANPVMIAPSDDLKPATLADFDYFRCHAPPDYNEPK